MSLEQEIEEAKKQLEEALAAEKEEEAEEEGAVEEAIEDASEEDTKEEEVVKEEPKKEEAPVNDAGWARLRREKQAAERKADTLAQENERLKSKKEEVETESPVHAPEIESLLFKHRVDTATENFAGFEDKVRQKNPEYDDIAQQYVTAIAHAILLDNPKLSGPEIMKRAKMKVLERADALISEGYENPVEEMFAQAKELGFKARAKETEDKPTEAKEAKPSLAKVAENRKRSAGMTGAAGREDGLVSKKSAAEMSPAEWKALPREERARLMSA